MDKANVVGQRVTNVTNHWTRIKTRKGWVSKISNVVIELENGSRIQPVLACDLWVSPPTNRDRRFSSCGLPITVSAKLLRWQTVKYDCNGTAFQRGKYANTPFGEYSVYSFAVSEQPRIIWGPWGLSQPDSDITIEVKTLKAGMIKAQELFNSQIQEIAKYMEAIVIEYPTPKQTF